jgi:methionyl-tRNA synthetase
MEKFYVTTAIDYVNASPHIGHAYEKIAADVLARFHRIRGKDVFFLTGVDEHGIKVERTAATAGKSPQEFVDEMSAKFKAAWEKLNVVPDRFIRTTEDEHKKVVQEMFRRMQEKGDIYKSSYTGHYCEGCEDFVRERDLDEQGNCPNHKKPPRQVSEENYFFKLSKYKDAIRKWMTEDPSRVQPDGRRKEVLNQLDDPEVTDFSVSRSRNSLKWGIPVPGDEDQVIYVWIDALTNYFTGGGGFEGKGYWPATLHLVGKDIIKFHCIYWPAMLMSAEVELPAGVFAHGFITVEGQKISKSLGNVIDPIALVDQYGADAVRYSLFSGSAFDQDGDFSGKELIRRVNSELANNVGNLLNRTLTLVDKNCGGKVPDCQPENVVRKQANLIHETVDEHMSKYDFSGAINAILALVDQANKYMNDDKPWTLFKEGKQKEGEEVLYTCLEVLRRTAMNLYPFTPELSQNMWNQLGYDDQVGKIGDSIREDGFFDMIPVGQTVRNQGPIFKRIEEGENGSDGADKPAKGKK